MIILDTKRCSIGQKLCRILLIVWFCVKIGCQHSAIVSLQIIFFKISQQIAKHIPRDCRFICKRRFGDQDWAAKLYWQTFYPVPRRFKTSRRFAVRFSSMGGYKTKTEDPKTKTPSKSSRNHFKMVRTWLSTDVETRNNKICGYQRIWPGSSFCT